VRRLLSRLTEVVAEFGAADAADRDAADADATRVRTPPVPLSTP
jgi:hypothetical protein